MAIHLMIRGRHVLVQAKDTIAHVQIWTRAIG